MRISKLAASLLRYFLAAGMIIAITLMFFALRGALTTPVIALLLLIPVGLSTAIWGLGPGVTSALCAFLGFNYFFISPYYTFTVHRPEDVVVLLVFLVVAVVVSQLVGRGGGRVWPQPPRETEATELYELSTAMAGKQDDEEVLRTLAQQILSSFSAEAVEIELSGAQGTVICLPERRGLPASHEQSPDIAIPIQAIRGVIGTIRLWRSGQPAFSSAQKRLLQAFASQGALALERAALSRADLERSCWRTSRPIQVLSTVICFA